MPSEPIRFVNAVWVKAQHCVRYTVLEQTDIAAPPRFRLAAWLTFIDPLTSASVMKELLAGETGVPENAIALVEVHDA